MQRFFSGDSTGIRTRVAAVRGRSLDRLTIEPHLLLLYIKRQTFSSINFRIFLYQLNVIKQFFYEKIKLF